MLDTTTRKIRLKLFDKLSIRVWFNENASKKSKLKNDSFTEEQIQGGGQLKVHRAVCFVLVRLCGQTWYKLKRLFDRGSDFRRERLKSKKHR